MKKIEVSIKPSVVDSDLAGMSNASASVLRAILRSRDSSHVVRKLKPSKYRMSGQIGVRTQVQSQSEIKKKIKMQNKIKSNTGMEILFSALKK